MPHLQGEVDLGLRGRCDCALDWRWQRHISVAAGQKQEDEDVAGAADHLGAMTFMSAHGGFEVKFSCKKTPREKKNKSRCLTMSKDVKTL